ncbi:hypothetical protein [Adhaeretor mobilis]|nr:hypothetical protein [Adhaeretor mobilis]
MANVLAVTFWFASRQIEATPAWRRFFAIILALVALILAISLILWTYTVLAVSAGNPEVPAIFAVIPGYLMVGQLFSSVLAVISVFVILILGILAIRSDFDGFETRHWTHWAGVITWPLIFILPMFT